MLCPNCGAPMTGKGGVCGNCGDPGTTVQMPKTQAMRKMDAERSSRSRSLSSQFPRWLIAGGLVAYGVSLVWEAINKHDILLIAVSVVLFLVAWVFAALERVASKAEANENYYLRTSGPVSRYRFEKDPEGPDYHVLAVGGQGLLINDVLANRREWEPVFMRLSWASVDYTKLGRTVLEIRDASGQVVYRHPKYHPDG